MDAIYELKAMLCDELEEYGKKDKLDVGGLEIVDKLAHTIKNLDKIIEAYEDEYSGENMGGSYEGGSYEGGSYARGGRGGRSYARGERGGMYSRARGRRGNVRRDSMGRYSRDSQMMAQELRDLMEEAPDERTKMEFKKFISKIESM